MSGPRALPKPAAETEKGFQGWVTEYADLRGWEWYHPWLSIHSPRGWPDLALCRPPRLVLAEIKGTTGELRPAQRKWLALLEQCPGVEVYVWWPSDRVQIESVLR